ncbi:hypothetical protein ACUXV3_08720 [Roseobacteraceae bacterium NS-SX3]
MADTDKSLQDLEDLFADVRAQPAELPPGLARAILADAEALQPGTAAPEPARRPLRWRQFLRAVGGWPGMGGLAAASAAGLWVGLYPPAFLPDPVELAGFAAGSAELPYESYDLAMMLAEEAQ